MPGRFGFEAESLEPGERAMVTLELGRPVAVEVGMRFAMREGGRTVGAGVMIEVN